jgi:pre-mRNA-splicing helicase BRR2
MGDVSTSDLKSAADEVLALLKSEDLNDSERKREIEVIVDRLSDEAFNTLTVLGQ